MTVRPSWLDGKFSPTLHGSLPGYIGPASLRCAKQANSSCKLSLFPALAFAVRVAPEAGRREPGQRRISLCARIGILCSASVDANVVNTVITVIFGLVLIILAAAAVLLFAMMGTLAARLPPQGQLRNAGPVRAPKNTRFPSRARRSGAALNSGRRSSGRCPKGQLYWPSSAPPAEPRCVG